VFVSSTAVKLANLQILTDGDLIWEIYLNAALTGPTAWGNLTNVLPANTTLEMDVGSTGFSGGILIASGLAAQAGAGNRAALTAGDLPDIDFVNAQPMTLVLSTVTGAATVSTVFNATEEW
jgi:hypothetical protein